ncbi:CTD small phosphatase-like protein 2, partial [Mucuna pruriens]
MDWVGDRREEIGMKGYASEVQSSRMKTKITTTCKKDGNYPHVSQQSNKIRKTPCSVVRVTNEEENLPISCQTSQVDSYKKEEIFKDHDNKEDMRQTCLPFNGCTYSMGQASCFSFDDCTNSTVVRDSLPSFPPSCSEPMLPYLNEPNFAPGHQFEAVNREEQMTWSSPLDDTYFNTFQMHDGLDSYAYDVFQNGTEFPSDVINVLDGSQSYNYNGLPDLAFAGTNFMNGGTEGNMLFPTLEESIGTADNHYEEFPEIFDSSWLDLILHQANPFPEELLANSSPFPGELLANSSQLDLDRIDYFDQETFVKNFLQLSDEANSLLPALVSQETSKKKKVTLVLDLDETLVHSSMKECDGADFTFQMTLEQECTVYVRMRPFLREFLEKVSDMFDVFIFTASKRAYAEKLLDVLDPDKKFFSLRLYRDSCTWQDRRCIKDLTIFGIDLAKVFIIDNTPEVFRFQVDNGIPIESWYEDPTDTALISMLPFLEKLIDVEDVRPFIADKFGARN